MSFRKDISLDELARVGNVAQFVSFNPNAAAASEFSRIAGFEPNHLFRARSEALSALLKNSPEGTINIRSFTPESPRSKDFYYGLSDLSEAEAMTARLSSQGLFVIANETVDIHDGGVSGVFQGGVAEFAPDDTPRCVEKEGTASLPVDWAKKIFSIVYGFSPDTVEAGSGRLEFSIHPKARGWRRTHTLMWEYEPSNTAPAVPALKWPNRFSRHIGDKVFGLLIADAMGLPVPRTTCIPRRVAPFSFGSDTDTKEFWTRTCPVEQEPGKFTTIKGWIDPFSLMAKEDPRGTSIASVLCQNAVAAKFSGAAITDADGQIVVEGASGEGDQFMLGVRPPEPLPHLIVEDVQALFRIAYETLGPIRFEWVHDGARVWIVQLHKGATDTSASTLVPGDASRWESFEASNGLEALRSFLDTLPNDVGINIQGEVGLTSHFADLLRKKRRPARIYSSLTSA